MERGSYLKRNLVRGLITGLVIGAALGLVELLILVIVDRMDLPLKVQPFLVLAYGALGLLIGLGLGLLRSLPKFRSTKSKLASTHPVHRTKSPYGGRWSRVGRNLVQGVGAGLLAGAIVGLVEVIGLVIADLSWTPLAGLLYASIAYGVLGLLGGVSLGLLRGLWCAWRDRDDSPARSSAWVAFMTLLISLGTFFVVHNRVRRGVLGIPLRPPILIEMIIADNVLLITAVALAVALGFLLRWFARRTRLAKPRWNVGLYVLLVLIAIFIGGGVRSVPVPAKPAAAQTNVSLASHLRDQPNVLFIVAETLRTDRLDCYGYGQSKHLTPHLDALARDGVLYRQMSAQASWTRPSVATILTSLYPTSHRATAMDMALPDDLTTLPEILAAAGYRTAGFTANVQTAPRFNFQQGYHEYVFSRPKLHVLAFDTPVATRFAVFTLLLRLQEVIQFPTPLPPYQDAAGMNRHALTWLEANKDTRFFLFLHYMDPHDPYFAHPYDGQRVASSATPNPPPSQAPYMSKLYDEEVAFLDTHLGVLFDQLKAWGLYDDALIVFTADHGEEFYEHGGWWHSETLYEEVLAVPLIIKYPGSARAGVVDEEFARSLDIAPTVLDVMGFPIPEAMQGVSLRPGAAVTRAEFAFAELDNIGRIRSIRTRRHKLIIASKGNRRGLPPVVLFDLQADPGEQNNLAAQDTDTMQPLRAALDRVSAFAETSAVDGQSRELDAATRERLRQLGY